MLCTVGDGGLKALVRDREVLAHGFLGKVHPRVTDGVGWVGSIHTLFVFSFRLQYESCGGALCHRRYEPYGGGTCNHNQ